MFSLGCDGGVTKIARFSILEERIFVTPPSLPIENTPLPPIGGGREESRPPPTGLQCNNDRPRSDRSRRPDPVDDARLSLAPSVRADPSTAREAPSLACAAALPRAPFVSAGRGARPAAPRGRCGGRRRGGVDPLFHAGEAWTPRSTHRS